MQVIRFFSQRRDRQTLGRVENFCVIHFIRSDVGLFRVESVVHLDHAMGDIQNFRFSSDYTKRKREVRISRNKNGITPVIQVLTR